MFGIEKKHKIRVVTSTELGCVIFTDQPDFGVVKGVWMGEFSREGNTIVVFSANEANKQERYDPKQCALVETIQKKIQVSHPDVANQVRDTELGSKAICEEQQIGLHQRFATSDQDDTAREQINYPGLGVIHYCSTVTKGHRILKLEGENGGRIYIPESGDVMLDVSITGLKDWMKEHRAEIQQVTSGSKTAESRREVFSRA